jgi:hypothetical protein
MNRRFRQGARKAIDVDARLREAIETGHTIVTANARQARFVRLDLAHAQAGRGAGAWSPPPILAWHAWLARLHEELRDGGRLGARCPTTPAGVARVGSSSRRTRQHTFHCRCQPGQARAAGVSRLPAPIWRMTSSQREVQAFALAARIRSGVARRAGSTGPPARRAAKSAISTAVSKRRALSCSSATSAHAAAACAHPHTLGARHASHLLAGAAETRPGVAPRVCESGTGARDGRALVAATARRRGAEAHRDRRPAARGAQGPRATHPGRSARAGRDAARAGRAGAALSPGRGAGARRPCDRARGARRAGAARGAHRARGSPRAPFAVHRRCFCVRA